MNKNNDSLDKNGSNSESDSSHDSFWTLDRPQEIKKIVQRRRSLGRKQSEHRWRASNLSLATTATLDGKKRKLKRSSSSSDFGGGWSETTSDIFYIYNDSWTAGAISNQPGMAIKARNQALKAKSKELIMHHSNLDVCKLTIREQLNLALIYYLTWSNLIRFVVILAASIWFLFNAVQVLFDFLQFDTVVYLEYQKPNWTLPPAISVCVICHTCSNNSEPIYADTMFPSMNVDHYPDPYYNRSGNDSELPFSAIDVPSVVDYPVELGDIVKSCILVPDGTVVANEKLIQQRDCLWASPVVTTIRERNKCYTYFSNIYGHMTQMRHADDNETTVQADWFKMEFQRFPYIRLHFDRRYLSSLHGDDNQSSRQSSSASSYDKDFFLNDEDLQEGVFVSLHDPDVPPDMLQLSSQRIKQSKWLDIKFSIKIEEWNPDDAKRVWGKRNCYSYNKARNPPHYMHGWIKVGNRTIVHNTGNGQDPANYRSRGECFLHCLWNYEINNHIFDLNNDSSKEAKCLNFYSVFTQEMFETEMRILFSIWTAHGKLSPQMEKFKPYRLKLCSENERDYRKFKMMKTYCQTICQKDCYEQTFYTESVYELQELTDGEALADIEWNTGMTVYIRHKNKMRLSSFLGAIGGHAHIWLGISVISILTFLVKVVQSGTGLFREEANNGCCHFTWLWCLFWRYRHETKGDSCCEQEQQQ